MLATALTQNGDLAAAESALRTAIRQKPSNPGPYNAQAQLLRQKGDLKGCRALFAQGAQAKQQEEAELARMLRRKP
jgi:Flp pilus assembly protein TadD